MSLPNYPEYKDSGAAWLGAVPAHWLVTPVKRFGKLKGGAGFPHVEQGHETEELPFHKVNALGRAGGDGALWGSENNISLATAQRLGAHIFPVGALVFAKVGAALLLGRIRTLRQAACIDNNMMGLVVDNDDVDVALAKYALNLVLFDLIANPGAVPSLNEGQIGSFPLVLPSLREQSAIAAFLDHETAKIDALIAEQEKLLALLAEKRQATISHAVTRGLDPNAPMKDSGIPWLGDVPAHWSITRLKFIATVQTGIAKGKDTTGKQTVTVPYLRVANVQDGHLALEHVATIDIESGQLERYRLQPGDVLMNEGGDFDKLGRGAVWDGAIENCIHQNHVFAVRPHGASPQWLNQITGSRYAQFYFMGRSKQSTNLASISSTNIMQLPIVLPPSDEQAAILKFVHDEMTTVDTLHAAGQHTIDLLKERRSALIAAAVTGKIDVRGLVEPQGA